MSFFTQGFAGIVKKRRQKADKKDAKPGSNDSSGSGSGKKEERRNKKRNEGRNEGRWDMLTDAYGRRFWQHSATGEWSYVYPVTLVSPVRSVNPSPMGYAAGPAVFTPSPVPTSYAPYGFVVPHTPTKESDQDDEQKDESVTRRGGWWETMYDKDGGRYWRHTVTNKKVFKDPYV